MTQTQRRPLAIHKLGAEGELAAANFLQKQGFNVLAMNYKTRLGEVDIIVKNKDIIAFVEVKTRTSCYFHPSHLITNSKQRKIAHAAQQFIQENNLSEGFTLRFDTVFVSHAENGVEFEYVSNAFQAPL